jgi:hypothetical protein
MKISFKQVPAIDKHFKTPDLPDQSVESTFNVKWMTEKGMQIPLLPGAVCLKGQIIKDEFIDSQARFLKEIGKRIEAGFAFI